MTQLASKADVSTPAPNPLPDNDTARGGLGNLWDFSNEMLQAAELDIFCAATLDVGGQLSARLRLVGTPTPITSLGTKYRGPITLRCSGIYIFSNNPTSMLCPGGHDLTAQAGDILYLTPKCSTSGVHDGWQLSVLGGSSFPQGTVMAFFNTTAPVGWTQVTAHNDKAIRIVSGAGGGIGGTVDFSSAFAAQTVAGVVGGTAITEAQMPPHFHETQIDSQGHGGDLPVGPAGSSNMTKKTSTKGGGQAHTHTFTGTAINLTVKYINMILASKA